MSYLAQNRQCMSKSQCQTDQSEQM